MFFISFVCRNGFIYPFIINSSYSSLESVLEIKMCTVFTQQYVPYASAALECVSNIFILQLFKIPLAAANE